MRQLAGARLLLVEDNDMNQELAVELLREAGIEVTIANHGQEALDLLAQGRVFDGILMDCHMPVMDGYTATRAIREDPKHASLPIIAITANVMASDRNKVIEAGMNDHIAKPLNVRQMFATLARWVVPAQPAMPGGKTVRPPRPADGGWNLPGIDTKAGLAISMGEPALYLRLLRKFLAHHADFATAFRRAEKDSDPAAAVRLAHTLKGTAANIGATGVQAAATLLESACKANQRVNVELALIRTLKELDAVLAVIAKVQADTPLPTPLSPQNRSEIQAQLERVEFFLARNDAGAADAIEVLAAAVAGSALEPLIAKAMQHVADYDFDQALAEVRSARDRLGRADEPDSSA